MALFESVLAVIYPEQVSFETRLIEKFRSVAQWLGSRLEVIHPVGRGFDDGIEEAIQEHRPDLILLTYTFDSTERSRALQADVEAALERSPVPVLLLPEETHLSRYPVKSLIVPISGESQKSDALRLALQVANDTQTPVDLVHVTSPGEPCTCGASFLESYGDEFHHEYPQLIDKVVTEGSPLSCREERQWVRSFRHFGGDASKEISNMAMQTPKSALVLEWKGTLMQGRAETLKGLLRHGTYPTLLVKERAEARSQLKVAGKFKSA